MSYTAEFDRIDAGEWHRLLLEFDDASIFQTWGYGAARWGEDNLSHAVIRKGGEAVGLAQSVLVGAPLFGKVLALVRFGPLCARRGAEARPEHRKATLAALREEYAARRRLCLRLRLPVCGNADEDSAAILAEDGWKALPALYRTYLLDLSRSEDQLRAAMDRKWRANLRKAGQCHLTVAQQNDQHGVDIFVDLHRQMRARKRFASAFPKILPELYRQLPDELRPYLFICRQGDVPVAASVVSVIGNHAFLMNSATGDAALELRAGHFLTWAIVRALKQTGRCRWYHITAGRVTPGVRQFTRGLVGGRAPEIAPGELEACANRLTAGMIKAALRLRGLRRRLRARST